MSTDYAKSVGKILMPKNIEFCAVGDNVRILGIIVPNLSIYCFNFIIFNKAVFVNI